MINVRYDCVELIYRLTIPQQDNKKSKHQSVQRSRNVASPILKELENDQRVPKTMRDRLKRIIAYEAERPRTVVLSDLDCLADLEISKKVST
jgi:hypothetical protein